MNQDLAPHLRPKKETNAKFVIPIIILSVAVATLAVLVVFYAGNDRNLRTEDNIPAPMEDEPTASEDDPSDQPYVSPGTFTPPSRDFPQSFATALNKAGECTVIDVGRIFNSPTTPYQTVQVSFLGSSRCDEYRGVHMEFYYRKGVNSDWVYAFGGSNPSSCEIFDADMQRAFEGTPCMRKNEDGNYVDSVVNIE